MIFRRGQKIYLKGVKSLWFKIRGFCELWSVVNSPLTTLSDFNVIVAIVPGEEISRAWYHSIALFKTNPIIPEPIQRLYGFSDISLLPFPNYVWGIHAKSHFHVALQRSTQLLLFLRFPILPFSPSSPFHSLRWICIMREFHLLLCVREGETELLINSSERKRLLIFFRIASPGSKE